MNEPTTPLNAAIENFKKTFENRSFSGRHPELGKMIKCAVCGRRHRSSVVCEQKYSFEAKSRPRHIPKAKRYFPHHSKSDLQLIERTRVVFNRNVPHNGNWFPLLDTESLMKTSRREAQKELVAEEEAIAKKKRRQRDISRRINLGLLPGGSR
jgi:hypothetical protein